MQKIQMLTAVSDDVSSVDVTFTAAVVPGDFATQDFTSEPSGQQSSSYVQNGPTGMTIGFGGGITGDTDITYAGSNPNFLSPQTVIY